LPAEVDGYKFFHSGQTSGQSTAAMTGAENTNVKDYVSKKADLTVQKQTSAIQQPSASQQQYINQGS